MPLTIVTQTANPTVAAAIFGAGCDVPVRHRGEAYMGGFWTSRNPQSETALVTFGAGPCQIILVHNDNGTGALGHYGGTPRPGNIADGVMAMVAALGRGDPSTVIFAAGLIGDGQDQVAYEMQVVAAVRAALPRSLVQWPAQDRDRGWSAAMYLPRRHTVALFTDLPDRRTDGRSDAGDGLAPHDYPFTD